MALQTNMHTRFFKKCERVLSSAENPLVCREGVLNVVLMKCSQKINGGEKLSGLI